MAFEHAVMAWLSTLSPIRAGESAPYESWAACRSRYA
jgi:hypothetical protein